MSELLDTVSDFFGRKPIPGEVGVEIEMEGRGLPLGKTPPMMWAMHQDGSLRGESAEYVLRAPIPRAEVEEALRQLSHFLNVNGAVLSFSRRTSVHVHLNALDLPLLKVYNILCLYLLFEDALVRFSGPDREGNLFCLRFRDAEALVQMAINCLETERHFLDFDENNRYSAFNLSALRKFGSIEFRSMRGNLNIPYIVQWVNILTILRDKAVAFDNPRSIIRQFSAEGPAVFAQSIGLPGLPFETRDADSMYEGMRLAQDIAFANSWDVSAPRKRSSKKNNPSDLVTGWTTTLQTNPPLFVQHPDGIVARHIEVWDEGRIAEAEATVTRHFGEGHIDGLMQNAFSRQFFYDTRRQGWFLMRNGAELAQLDVEDDGRDLT